MAFTLQLSQEQASVLLPVLTQLSTSQLLKGTPGTSHESNSSRSSSSPESEHYWVPKAVSTPSRSMSDSGSSGVDQFSLDELFSGKKKNAKSSDAHNFLHVSVPCPEVQSCLPLLHSFDIHKERTRILCG